MKDNNSSPMSKPTSVDELYAVLKNDKRADTWVIPTRVMEIIVEYYEAKINHLIERSKLEARIDEIGAVRTDYGPYRVETYIHDKSMTIEERFQELKELEEKS